MSGLDGPRAKLFSVIERAPGALGDVVRRINDDIGRPLAPLDELADRRAFAAGEMGTVVATAATGRASGREPAPVIVYHLDKHRSDLSKLTDILDGADVPYRVMNLEGDPATIEAVRRDADGRKLPMVFVAGECIGAREELNALDRSGELVKKVWG